MADLRAELTDQQELNHRLQADIIELQREQEKDQMLEDVVNQVQHELKQVKVKADMKELELQEITFNFKDAESRVKELEQKQNFFKDQAEKAIADKCKLEEELLLQKKENESSASADTLKADLRDKYNSLLQENRALKKQLESKFNAERFNQEQELNDANRDKKLLEAKNRQLENRIEQLEGRLGGVQDSELAQ